MTFDELWRANLDQERACGDSAEKAEAIGLRAVPCRGPEGLFGYLTPDSAEDHLEETSLWTARSGTDIHAHISSTPAAADIQVDGEYVGATPLNIDLTCCFHDVTISKPGLKTWTGRVRNTGRQVNFHADLHK